MMKIGMVVAVEREIRACLEEFGTPTKEETYGNIVIRTYVRDDAELFVAHSGMGEIAAAATTQLLISLYHVDLILNCGVVGGLTDEMATAKTTVVEKVVHYDVDSSAIDPVVPGQYEELPDVYIPTTKELVEKVTALYPDVRPSVCASADKFVAEAEKKAALHEAFSADICDMESAGIALTCHRNHTKLLMLKTVADSITGGAEGFENACLETARVCMGIAEKLIKEL